MPGERERLIAMAHKIKREIELDFNTIAHWNEHVRKPGEEPIDPDPDGSLACALAYLNGILNGDVFVALERNQR